MFFLGLYYKWEKNYYFSQQVIGRNVNGNKQVARGIKHTILLWNFPKRSSVTSLVIVVLKFNNMHRPLESDQLGIHQFHYCNNETGVGQCLSSNYDCHDDNSRLWEDSTKN